MGVTSIQTLINGIQVKEPVDWQNHTIYAAFGTDSSQPQIETDTFEFVLDGAAAIHKHVADGNIFERLECQQIFSQRDNTYVSLQGYFDVSDGYQELEPTWGSVERPNRVKVKFKQDESITNFLKQINGVTYGSLVKEGLISSQDYTTINTTIIKRSNFIDMALLQLSLYTINRQIYDAIRALVNTISTIAAFIATLPGGSIGAALFLIASLLIQIAYAILLIAIMVNLMKSLLDLFITPVIKNKGIAFRTLLRTSCEKFGYSFESNIEELDLYHYMPSKPYDTDVSRLNSLVPKHIEGKVGIPNVSDYGYLINEFWDLMKTMFNVRVAVVDNTVIMYNVNDEYWLKQSTFVPHETINFPVKEYNTDALKQTRMMSFITDTNDTWTVENYTGTSYEIKTSNESNTFNGSITGLERLDIPLCLPNSKTTWTNTDKVVILLAGVVDLLAKTIFMNSNLKAQFKANRINTLKVSQNDYSVAKIVPLEAGKVPSNHRELISAKYLMEKFHYGKSFVGDALGQKIIYNDVTIPFTLADLKKTLKSGTFPLGDGRIGEFIDIEYNFSQDTADCSISVQEVYTTKLKETTFEP